MEECKFKVALMYPPISERFCYSKFGPRIAILSIGYLQSILEKNGIASKQVNLDKLLHYHTDYWEEFDKRKALDDDRMIEDYIEGRIKDASYDKVYDYLMSCCNWSEYSIAAISHEIQFINDSYAPPYYRFLKTIAEEFDVKIIIGGLGFPCLNIYYYFKRFPFISYICFGKVDSINLDSFLKIVQFEKDNTGDPADIQNICYRNKNNKALINFADENTTAGIEREYILNPIFDLRNNKDFRIKYSHISSTDKGFPANAFDESLEIPIIPYRFSVNCINNCAFCMSSSKGYPFAFKEAEQAVDDIDRLMQNNQSPYFMFFNAMINFSKKYLEKMLNLIKKRNLDLYFTDSAEVYAMDRETLQIIKEMGGIGLWYGLECPTDKMLNYINKRCTVAQCKDVLSMSDEEGIWNGANLIVGLPHETQEDIDQTVDFIRENVSIVNMWQVSAFYLVQSQFLENPEKYKIKILDRELSVNNSDGELVMASFDEIGGMQWEEKKKKRAYGFKLLNDSIDKYAEVPNIANATFLFYAYTKFGRDKTLVKKWLMDNYIGKAPEIYYWS